MPITLPYPVHISLYLLRSGEYHAAVQEVRREHGLETLPYPEQFADPDNDISSDGCPHCGDYEGSINDCPNGCHDRELVSMDASNSWKIEEEQFDDWDREREFMRSQSKTRELTEDERHIYGL